MFIRSHKWHQPRFFFNLIPILIPDISKTWWWNVIFLGFPKFFAYILLKIFSSPYSDFPLFCLSYNKLFGFQNRVELWQFSLKMKGRICCFLSSISSLLFKCFIYIYIYIYIYILLYPARSQWGTYRGYCSRRDGARTSVKTGIWAGRTHSQ